jgi:hypothetical protein
MVAFVLALVSVGLKDLINEKTKIINFDDYQKPIISNNDFDSASFDSVSNLREVISELKEMTENAKHLLESSEKKNITKILNRISQGLFRFLKGELEFYNKKDVELLFEEIQELFISINHNLIIPVENDLFNQDTMISRDFIDTNDASLDGKVFRTTILGVKEIMSNIVVKKAEVIVYRKINS